MNQVWVVSPYGKRTQNRTYKIKAKKHSQIWQYDLENNVIALGSSSMRAPNGTFSNPEGKSSEELEKIMKNNHADYTQAMITGRAKVLWEIYNNVKEGDFIVAKEGQQTMLAIGKVFKKSGKAVYFSIEQGIERTANKYNPHPNFINVDWKEDRIDFGTNVFLRDRFGPLRKIVVSRNYSKYGKMIQDRIYDLWGEDVSLTNVGLSENDKQNSVMKPKRNSNQIKKNINVFKNGPKWLISLQKRVKGLRNDLQHKERAHESLVEMFYEGLGYERFSDIRHRQGRIDIRIMKDNKVEIVTEVKKNWGLTKNNIKVLRQAYGYALETGARYVIITNGDYYAIFDRKKGSSYDSQFIGDLQLTNFQKKDLEVIDLIKKSKI
jgi:hypothetical protein